MTASAKLVVIEVQINFERRLGTFPIGNRQHFFEPEKIAKLSKLAAKISLLKQCLAADIMSRFGENKEIRYQ